MTNLQEAIKWLADNAPNVRLSHSDTRLVAGCHVGDPTVQRVTVVLAPEDEFYSVSGEGSTILEAVMTAVGAMPEEVKTDG